jgi:hypothetical protein
LASKAHRKKFNGSKRRGPDIRAEGDDAGVVTAASHPRVDTIAQVSNAVKNLIDAADKEAGEIRAALVEKGYEFKSLYFYRSGGAFQPNAGSRVPLECDKAQEASAQQSVNTLIIAVKTLS